MKNISPQVRVGVAASHPADAAACGSSALALEEQNLRSVWWSEFLKGRRQMCACSRNTKKGRQELMHVPSVHVHTVHVPGNSRAPSPKLLLKAFGATYCFL